MKLPARSFFKRWQNRKAATGSGTTADPQSTDRKKRSHQGSSFT